MGDMADYYLDMEDFYCDGLYDESAADIACKFCRRGGFQWWQDELDGRWRLVTPTGRIHSCKAYGVKEYKQEKGIHGKINGSNIRRQRDLQNKQSGAGRAIHLGKN